MPRRKKRWSKISAWTVVILGLAAGVTIILVTAWFQKDILSNALYLFLFILIVATVSLNLFSTWIQYSVLHDTYTLPSVTIFLSITVVALSISALLQSHYYRSFRQSINNRRRASAKSMTPIVLQRKESTAKKRPPRQKRKKILNSSNMEYKGVIERNRKRGYG